MITPAALIAAGSLTFIAGIGAAAWILRWEIRAQLRDRRHGGFLIGGDR